MACKDEITRRRASVRGTIAAALLVASCSPGPQPKPAPAPPEEPNPCRVEHLDAMPRHYGFEATLRGRVLEPGREPAVDALVTLYEKAPGWGGRTRILGRRRTDDEGRFELTGIAFGDASHVLAIHGRSEFAVKQAPVPLATCGFTDLSDLELEPYFVLEGRYDGPLRGERHRAWLDSTDERGPHRGAKLDEEGRFRLEGLPAGTYELSVRSDRGRGRRDHRAMDWTLSDSAPRQRVVLDANGVTLTATVVDEGPEVEGRLRAAQTRRLAGRFIDEDGEPVEGLNVLAVSSWLDPLRLEPGARCVTDANGRFQLMCEGFQAKRLHVYGAVGALVVELGPKDETKDRNGVRVRADAGESMEIVAGGLRRADLPTRVKSPASSDDVTPEYSIGRDGHWVEVPFDVATLEFVDRDKRRVVRAPEHLPRVLSVLHGEDFDWSDETRRSLAVHSDGAPVTGARVQLVQLRSEAGPIDHVAVGSVPDSGRGVFTGFAPWTVDYEATVIADGFEPAVVPWDGRPETVVELRRRATAVTFRGVERGQFWIVGRAGAPNPSLVWCRGEDSEDDVFVRELASGRYDGVLFEAGRVVAGQTFEVREGRRSLEIDARSDTRRRVVLKLPTLPEVDSPSTEAPSEWAVWVTRGPAAGSSYGAAAFSTRGGTRGMTWPAAQIEVTDARTRALSFNGAGRFTVHVRDSGRTMATTLSHEVTIGTASDEGAREIHLPELTGVVTGTMPAFSADLTLSHHGIAGPRYFLRRATPLDRDRGWSAIGFVPPRVDGEGPGFRIEHLPPGEYFFEDHLYELGFLDEDGLLGGMRVTIDGDATVDVGDVEAGEPRDVTLTVVDHAGAPVTGAMVTAHDPMWEAWTAFTRRPSTATMADHPITPPFEERLDRNGQCVLPRVRRDAIVLRITLDSRHRVTARLDVEGDAPSVTWRLPDVR